MAKKKRKKKARTRKPRASRKAAKGRKRVRPRAKRRSPKRPASRRRVKLARKPKKLKKPRKPKKPKKLKKPKKVVDPRVAQAMKLYEEAIRHFNKQHFSRAKSLFEKVAVGFSREMAERARVHIAICEQRLQRPAPVRLRSADDHYHYAVSQINLANYEEARSHLQKARKLAPKADYVFYALASVAALTGEAEEALKSLQQAIKLRPENRYHARNDADFKLLEDDARFQELLYPDRPADSGPRALHP